MKKETTPLKLITWSTLVTLLLLLALAFFWSSRNSLVFVRGDSMEPTFSNGDVLVIKKEKEFKKGSLVVFPVPQEWHEIWKGRPSSKLVKHIALAPGDTLSWDGHAWSANGQEFSSLKAGACPVEPMEYTLKEDEIFVKGDTTTSQTLDSREAFCNGAPFTVKTSSVDTLGSLKRIL